jgi:hypothetical protein
MLVCPFNIQGLTDMPFCRWLFHLNLKVVFQLTNGSKVYKLSFIWERLWFFFSGIFFLNSILRSIHSQFLLVVSCIDRSLTWMDKEQCEAIYLDEMNSIWCIRAVIARGILNFIVDCFICLLLGVFFLIAFCEANDIFLEQKIQANFASQGCVLYYLVSIIHWHVESKVQFGHPPMYYLKVYMIIFLVYTLKTLNAVMIPLK